MVKNFLVLIALLTSNAFALPGQIGENKVNPTHSAFTNYITNPSAFKAAATGTSTSSATLVRDTDAADSLDGIASFLCDASAQNGYCSWQTDTLNEGDKTGNCEFKGLYKGDASQYKAVVINGSDEVAYSDTLLNVTDWTPFSVNAPCASSVTVRLKQTGAGTGAAVNIGRLYWGKVTNVGTVAQASLVASGYFATTASCTGWSRTNNALGAFASDADCPGPTVELNPGPGVLLTTDADLPKFTVNNLPPGAYEVKFYGMMDTRSGTGITAFAINDGTTTSGRAMNAGTTATSANGSVVGYFNYTAAGNRTFELYGAASGAIAVSIDNATSLQQLGFSIVRYPSNSEVAYRPEVNAAYYSGYHGSGCSAWTRTNTSYGAITDDASGCTLTDLQKSGITAAAVGSVSPAILMSLPRTGAYDVCAYPVASGGSAAVHQFRLWDGTTTIAEGTQNLTSDVSIPLCGLYNATTLTPTFTVQCKASSGTCTIDGGGSDVAILWTVKPHTANMPNPILVGSQNAPLVYTGSTKVLDAVLNCDAGSVITNQTGTTAEGVATIGNISTGVCAGTFAGMWSSTTGLGCTASLKGSTLDEDARIDATTATAFNLYCFKPSTGAALTTCDVQIHCWGPR